MKNFYAFLFCLLVVVSLNAQTVFNLNDTSLTFPQELSEAQRQANSWFDDGVRVRPFLLNPQVRNHQNLQVGDEVVLQLFNDVSHPATVLRKTTDVNGVTAVTLKLNTYQYAYAYLALSPNSYLVTVDIPEENQKYSSRSNTTGSQNYMFQLDETIFQNLKCGLDDESPMPGNEDGDTPSVPGGIDPLPGMPINDPGLTPMNTGCHVMPDINDPATIGILIAYTPAALNWANNNLTNIANAIAVTMAHANQVSINNNLGITFQLSHSVLVNYTEVDMGSDWINLLTEGNGLMDEVHQLRRDFDADLVALLNYYNSGGVAGIADLLTSKYGNNRAVFSASRINFAANSNTFIHEIGHNMGAMHNPNQLDDPGPTIWENWPENTWTAGWRWLGSDSNYYIDLMSYPASNQYGDGLPSFQIPYFSDPNHTHLGGIAGDPVLGNNARTLRETKHYVARYHESIDYCGAGNAPLYGTTSLYISNVTMGDINNTSGGSSVRYGDFTAIATCMFPGDTQTLEISVFNSSSTRPVKVWIDWNDDKIFDPVNELVYDSGTGAAQHSLNITAPLGVTFGQKRMRIRTYSTFIEPVVDSPCGYSSIGEVEDYTINLQAPLLCTEATTPLGLTVGTVTANSAELSWTTQYGIEYYELRYRETEITDPMPDWTTVTPVNYPFYSLSGLTLSTEYEVQLRSVCNGTPSDYSASVIFTTLSYDYCVSTSNSTTSSYIKRVQLNTIDNITANENGGYSDFTNLSTELVQGQSYTITITPERVGGHTLSIGYRVWIDYNFDGDFNGPSELVGGTNFINSNPTQSFTFTVPYGVVPGATRMRVSAKQGGNPTACEIFTNGEVEDYTVVLGANPPCTAATVPANLSLQGTTSTTASLYWNGVAGASYDLRYKLIGDQNWTTLTDLEFPNTTITGLLLSQEYEAQVRSKCDGGATSAYSASLFFFVDYAYCNASLGGGLGINRVRLVNIDHPSGISGYSNFTNESTELQPGATYNLTINNNGNGTTHYFVYAAYIDYNYDGTFDVPSERIWNQTATNLTEVTGSFTIPAEVPLNRVRLRIVMVFTNSSSVYIPPPCLVSTNNGEVEDYTVILVTCDEATVPENLTLTGLSNNLATLSWDSVPGAAYELQYREIGAQSWIDVTGLNQNSVTIEPLLPATLYEARVRSVCDGTNSDYTSPLVFETYATPPDYCTAGATNATFERISNVTFNSINNNSTSTAGYEDFTHISTNVEKGETYSFTASFTGQSYPTDQVLVWIDFNQNGDFTDPGEQVLVTPQSTSPWQGNISISTDALNGPTRMRVRLHDAGDGPNSAPCGTSSYGQVEDYTVIITPSGYVFQNGSWSPQGPEGMSTAADDIHVLNGSIALSNDVVANNLFIQSGATLQTRHVMTLNGNIENDGLLLMKSNALSTGQLNTFSGNINGAGEVTIERFIPARRAFRLLSTAVTTSGTIRDNWQEGQNNLNTSTNNNVVPGFGTHITGSTNGANGFDATPSGNPSLFTLNNATQSWVAAPNTDIDGLLAGTAYRLMVRGDRSVDVTNNSTTPTNTILRTTGVLHTGPYAVSGLSQTENHFNFIGNPYPAAVDMNQVLNAVTTTNMNQVSYWVWDPTLGGIPTPGQQGGRGAFVAVNVINNTSNNISSQANRYLQPGQAAFVQTAANGTATMSFQEQYKAVTQPQTQVFNVLSSIRINLYDAGSFANGSTSSDGVLLSFSEDGTNTITYEDAMKFYNLDENLASVNDETLLSIESRALPEVGETIPLFTNQYRKTNYMFEVSLSEMNEVLVFLKDHYTGTLTELFNNETTLYAFQVDPTIAESMADDRFEIVFEEMLSTNELSFGDGFVLFPNPTNGSFTIATRHIQGDIVNLTVSSITGQKVYSNTLTVPSNGQLVIEIPGLAAGLYMVELVHPQGGLFTSKLVKK